jgi:hypothetical protein
MDSGMSEDYTSVWRAVKTGTIDDVQKYIIIVMMAKISSTFKKTLSAV